MLPLNMEHWPTGQGKLNYTHRVTVAAADIDANGHVNNVVYVRWAQEAALAHWQAAATAELQAAIVWVVVSHGIEYKRPALFGDALTVKTWVETSTTLTSERHCRIVRERDGMLLARSRTVWCAVNPGNGKPRRLPAQVREIFLLTTDEH
ncbi:MAG: acyl-CoA thioesterase [Verrucomicrobiales bacterium]|jgi:acyl-CoA thioester hydrolase|nr:acyl-CoA thioesterase [Verrucomicrobiales bacterium]